MSASSKKKLRSEQQAAKMTERQLAEQKEAKKLKLYTIAFVTVLVALLVFAITFGVNNIVTNSGSRERNTVAMTVGSHDISNAEMNYYFINALNTTFSGDNAYLLQLGMLDTTLPLDQQPSIFGDGTQTWADYLMEYATNNVKANYAMVDAAAAAGYTLPEKYIAAVDSEMANLPLAAISSGYPDVKTYLKAMYGNGASEEGYRAFLETTLLAQAYYSHHANNLTFEDSELKALGDEDPHAYTSYDYNYYYLNVADFRQGGTQDENGTVTYSDEEKAAAVSAAEEAAKSLTSENITSVAALDKAIGQLSINANAETPVTSTVCEDHLYTGITVTQIADWLISGEHAEGDKTYFPAETTTDGVTTVNGYYVVYFVGADENLRGVNSVRHILVQFEGTADEQKAAALSEAEAILTEWKSGEATEESFAQLANAKSDDGDGTTGGLYKYVGKNTGYVESFENWAADEARQAGDTGIVETEYGYHIMYFVGQSGRTYRDVLIENTLVQVSMNTWYTEQVEAMTVTPGDISYVLTDKVISAY